MRSSRSSMPVPPSTTPPGRWPTACPTSNGTAPTPRPWPTKRPTSPPGWRCSATAPSATRSSTTSSSGSSGPGACSGPGATPRRAGATWPAPCSPEPRLVPGLGLLTEAVQEAVRFDVELLVEPHDGAFLRRRAELHPVHQGVHDGDAASSGGGDVGHHVAERLRVETVP